ncbi:MAG: 30S ribosomal protein S14 [Kofleriaceae bacterium]|nr:30S ribosomal protein S14 [Kofleriaceae bacterium]
MARMAQVVRLGKQRKLVAKYARKRAALKSVLADPAASGEAKDQARTRLEALPRDSSPTRLRNRCRLTGRSRGYLRKFDLARNEFRRLALQGDIPGVIKSSW